MLVFVANLQRKYWANKMAKAKAKLITIKLVKSPIGKKPNQQLTLKALGLTKVNQVAKKVDNEAVRGMIETVKHLVEVVE